MNPRTKGRLRERGFLLNWVGSCFTGGRSAICDTAFAFTSPATPSHRPDRVLFEILRQKLSCNELPALQSVFSDSGTELQPAFAFHYRAPASRARRNQWKLRYRRSSISKKSEKPRYRSTKLRSLYMTFSFDIEVILYTGLLRYRRDFDIEVLNFDIRVWLSASILK